MLRDGRATVHSMISRKVRCVSVSYLQAAGTQTSSQLMLPNHLTNWHWCHIVTKLIFPSVLTLSWSVSCVYMIPPLTGDHLRLRPEQLQGLSDQVEQRGGDHVQPVPGGRGDQMFARPLRAARPQHRGGNEEVASFPRAAVGPISVAPRRADWKSWWRVSVQVSIWSVCKCVQRAYLYAPVLSTHAVGFTCMCWGFQASLKFFKCVCSHSHSHNCIHFSCGSGWSFRSMSL